MPGPPPPGISPEVNDTSPDSPPLPEAPPDAATPHEPILRIPPATGWLIAINVAIHIARGFLPAAQDDVVVERLAFNPAYLTHYSDANSIASLVTYQFLHGGWDHLIINMVSLLAFGAGIERPLGKARFLFLYLLCGIAGALFETAITPNVNDFLVGASASISGLFGALMLLWGLHRRGKRPMGIVPMILLWIALFTVTGVIGLGSNGVPVAWLAHIGGFIAGVLLIRPLARTLR